MKSEHNIFVAFVLNLAFSVFELVGGLFIGSIALLSDSVHDFGDAVSIGLSFLFERKSRRAPDGRYTYGYARFSLLGGVLTTLILVFGSLGVLYHAVLRILHPIPIRCDGMILFAVFGVIVNAAAVFFTQKGTSLNQKAVNLHLWEDVLGWIVVLIGALVMRFTGLTVLDPILSILSAVVILIHAAKLLGAILRIFLQAVPSGMDHDVIRQELCALDGVCDVHHIHLWSLDGNTHAATMHVVAPPEMKPALREKLRDLGVPHVTLEFETEAESCPDKECHIPHKPHHHHHH